MFDLNKLSYRLFITALLAGAGLSSCTKLIEIDPPISTVGTEIVFKNDQNANAALAAAYSLMASEDGEQVSAFNGGLTIGGGLLSDELELTYGSQNELLYPYNTSQMVKADPYSVTYWAKPYRIIYTVNSVLEGLASANNISDSTRQRITGEAKFLRAYAYFLLVNCFGEVPLVMVTDVNQNMSKGRSPVPAVYAQIEADLKEAEALLQDNYAATGNNKSQVNKYGAATMLARVYLYQQKWAEAAAQADLVINSRKYQLTALEKTFEPNSQEAIWQLQCSSQGMGQLPEAFMVSPLFKLSDYPDMEELYTTPDMWSSLSFMILPQLKFTTQQVQAFEAGDQRLVKWASRTLTPKEEPYNAVPVYYAWKYALADPQGTYKGNLSMMALRLGEVYLIRAEANAQLGKATEAAADINIIRTRAGLGNTTAASRDALLDAVMHERQTELFAEGGHRWLDLKRTGKASAVLSKLAYKQPWSDHRLLLPIPISEMIANPKLMPNPGY